jgi:diacylglycerol kinase (ATP)
LAAFRSQLNPAQVVDLDESKMDDGLKWFRLLDDYLEIKSYCVVAGGDGTVGWVLNSLDKMNLKNPPTSALLPLGTGNDLARSLGYGPGEDASLNVRDFLRKIVSDGIEINGLDRWHIQVNPYRHFGIQLPRHDFYMQNYVSIGVDALVTYNFHKARESPFYLISSRIINKLIYFSYGTKDVLERECKNLNQILELYIDDQRIKLPPVESVVILNIPCWGAGVRPWSLGSEHKNFPEPTISDGLLEVFCVYSSFHIAQMQVGLSEPHRIGQARSVKIKLRGSAPMQIDGEPWEQHPAEIDINFHNKIPVLQLQSQ